MAKAALTAADRGPTAEELSNSPCLEIWQTTLVRGNLCLSGMASGHPLLPDGPVDTSPLIALSEDCTWARTLSRFYRLGISAQSGLAEVMAVAVIEDAYGWPSVDLATARVSLKEIARWLRQSDSNDDAVLAASPLPDRAEDR